MRSYCVGGRCDFSLNSFVVHAALSENGHAVKIRTCFSFYTFEEIISAPSPIPDAFSRWCLVQADEEVVGFTIAQP